MSIQAYHSFIDQFCHHAGIEHPATMYEAAEFDINDVRFMLQHGGTRAPFMGLVYCAMGPLDIPERALALQRLLEVNLVMFGSPGSPSFSYNPDSHEVLLTCSIFLPEATGRRALELLTTLSIVAQEWRRNHFLDDDAANVRVDTTSTGSVIPSRHAIPRHLAEAFSAMDHGTVISGKS